MISKILSLVIWVCHLIVFQCKLLSRLLILLIVLSSSSSFSGLGNLIVDLLDHGFMKAGSMILSKSL